MGVGLKKPSKTVEALVKKAIKKKSSTLLLSKALLQAAGVLPT